MTEMTEMNKRVAGDDSYEEAWKVSLKTFEACNGCLGFLMKSYQWSGLSSAIRLQGGTRSAGTTATILGVSGTGKARSMESLLASMPVVDQPKR